MKLLKIQDRFINIDLIQTATLEPDSIVLTISGEAFRFSGIDAKMIASWLNRFALDLTRDQNRTQKRITAERPPEDDWVNSPLRGNLFRNPFAS